MNKGESDTKQVRRKVNESLTKELRKIKEEVNKEGSNKERNKNPCIRSYVGRPVPGSHSHVLHVNE
jgi:hypothetical protein